MRKWVAIGLSLLLLLLWPVSVKGEEEPLETGESSQTALDPQQLDFGAVDQILEEAGQTDVLKQQTESQTVGKLLERVMTGEVTASVGDWIAAFGESLWGNMREYLGLMLQVIGLTLLSQLFTSLDLRSGEGSAAGIGFLCVYGVLALALVQSFQIAYEEANQTVDHIKQLSLYMMPAMAAVAAAGGCTMSSALQSGAMTTGLSLILSIMKNVMMVGVLWITILEVVNCISKKAMLSQMISLMRSILEKGIKAVSGLYLLLMGIFGLVTPAADRVVYKASSSILSAVPVVGSALSGAMDAVLTGSVMIKNGIGAAACIVLLCLCMVPVAKLTAMWLSYRLLAAFLLPVADQRVIHLLASLGRSVAMLLGALVSSVIIFTGAVGIFAVLTGK